MTGLRLVPADGKPFPYDRALRLLKTIPTIELDSLDIPALVAAGKKMGWSQVVIDHHWTLMANGKCFRFDQDDEPELSGTLYEDNLFFSFFDGDHEAACRPLIEKIARQLGIEIREE